MLDKLLGGGLVGSVGKIVDELHTSQEEKDNAKIKLQALENELKTKQIEVNQVEAGHKSIFVAGWRPATGWLIVGILFYSYILQPFTIMVLKIMGKDIEIPNLNVSEVMPIILGMLGLGFSRSYEKKNKVAREK
jgi:hypothetical protein|tara:strand:- start:639 stop:1040 length:402 start_codon:yes stop_codon:yes gene_type:complete